MLIIGVLLRRHTVNEICHIVEELSKESVDLLKERSEKTKRIAFERFSKEIFLKNLESHIHKIINIKSNKHNL